MGKKTIRFETVGSTNAIAMEIGERSPEDVTVVLAQQQTAGQGRRGRYFFSPPGGLYMSVILRPEVPPGRLPMITLAAGIACSLALEKLCGLEVKIKWPNDLYVDGKKLGGILTEAAPYCFTQRKISFVVVGIGINVNVRLETFPPELRNHVISLYDVGRRSYDMEALAADIVEHLTRSVRALTDHADAILHAWRQRDFLLNREVRWRDPQGSMVHGCGAGLMDDGCYCIRTADNGQLAVVAGDLIISADPVRK